MDEKELSVDQIMQGYTPEGAEMVSKDRRTQNLIPFQKGQCANPGGKRKETDEEKQARKEMMEQIRSLGPRTYAAMLALLDNPRTQAMAKVKLIEIILSYIVGKPESKVDLKVTTEEHVITSETRIQALIQSIRIGGESSEDQEKKEEAADGTDEIVGEYTISPPES